ncbi:MAG: nitroreductase family deazaflavin-dependent oxidoreductase [Chloroflexi bacterium]|nr:nitroreductase family deazaflavin-dependent oxidoreductase [Chloroflexota bacterium]
MATSEQEFNQQVIGEFRANEGRVGGQFEGAPVLLLHHTGAKSGARRVSPLMYQTVGDSYAVFASNAGQATHPAWYHNLLAHPSTSIEVGPATIDVSARVADEEERASIWDRQKQRYPGFADYEAGTTRQIPVVLLEPTTPTG